MFQRLRRNEIENEHRTDDLLLCKQEVIGSIPFSSTKFGEPFVGEWGLVAQLVRARA